MESTKREPFVLLKNKLFYVTFDIPTPRPHFMVLPHEKDKINPDSGEMGLGERQELMKAVRSVMSTYEIPSGILSIHRGSWFTEHKDPTFHAHICVDVKLYLKVFENEKSNIPDWPHQDYVTKEWKANDDTDSYDQNVRGYPYKDYFADEVAAIKKNLNTPVKELPSVDVAGIKQVMHPKYPMIGFVGKRNEVEPENLLRVIEEFARQKLGLTNLKNKDEIDGGCHVCLYLGKVPPSEGWSPTGEGEEVLGYIVTSGPHFYQRCSEEYRKIWLPAFEKSSFICKT